MSDVNRREFLEMAGAVTTAVAAPAAEKEAGAPCLWIDPGRRSLPRRPWRKIHLDFHNSRFVEKIGAAFDANEFGDTLAAANVDAIVVFAKDMHGHFYYPSRYGPVHPGLDFDLLGAQVEACRKRNIKVHAYYCTTWDHHLARTHPEWLVYKKDGTTYLPRKGKTPGWTALCIAHEEFVQLVLDHTREFVGGYELDGPWFDMPWPIKGECYCGECLRLLRERELDPYSLVVQRRHKQELYKAFLERLHDTAKRARPGCQVEYNEQGGYGLAERVAWSDNMDIEALPTAKWGYFYFPINVRYIRTHGVTVCGQTGRFLSAWGDFGGLKLPMQLKTEVAAIVANGAQCCVGDQMPPNGRLDPAVYYSIGQAYGHIKELEPYLEGAVPVTEAALVTGGLPFDKPSTPANYGLLKLLVEARVQFDVVEPDAEWARYGLIVLADDEPVTPAVAERLHAFIAGGGAVVANHCSGLLAASEQTWLERYGFAYAGKSPFRPAYLVPKVKLTGELPDYQYALYEGASQWQATGPAEVWATLGEPAFQRTAEHYTSHRQTPFERETGYAVLARSGPVGLVGFPLGLSYYRRGYWIYREAFRRLVGKLLPARLVETDAPLSTEIAVTHQAAEGRRKERYLVHVLNFSALRKSPEHPSFYEDPIPLTGVRVQLNLPLKKPKVRAVVAGARLKPRRAGAGVAVTLARVPVHEIVVFEIT